MPGQHIWHIKTRRPGEAEFQFAQTQHQPSFFIRGIFMGQFSDAFQGGQQTKEAQIRASANVDLAQIDLQVTIETKTSSPSVRTQLTIRNTRTTDQPKHTVTVAINKDGAIILHRNVRGDRAGSNYGTIKDTDASCVKQTLLQVLGEMGSWAAAVD